jgi:hypothetical protein
LDEFISTVEKDKYQNFPRIGELSMKNFKQLTFSFGLVGFLAVVGMAWYCQNAPVGLTIDQESTIWGGGWELWDTDCQDGPGGCTPYGQAPNTHPNCISESYTRKLCMR